MFCFTIIIMVFETKSGRVELIYQVDNIGV